MTEIGDHTRYSNGLGSEILIGNGPSIFTITRDYIVRINLAGLHDADQLQCHNQQRPIPYGCTARTNATGSLPEGPAGLGLLQRLLLGLGFPQVLFVLGRADVGAERLLPHAFFLGPTASQCDAGWFEGDLAIVSCFRMSASKLPYSAPPFS